MWTNDLAPFPLRQTVNHAADTSPIGGAGTHRTWLRAGVHRAPRQKFGRIRQAGSGHQYTLGMAGSVAGVAVGISGFHQNRAVGPDQDGAERVGAPRARLFGDVERKADEVLVSLHVDALPVQRPNTR